MSAANPGKEYADALSKNSGFAPEFIFGPANPIKGENTSADPSMLPPGFFQSTQNLRYSNNEISVRDGTFVLASAPPVAGAAYRGSFSCYLDGQLRMFVAYRISSATRIYQITGLGTNTWGFNEITNGSGTAATDETAAEAGTNNGTRFTADGYVTFAVASDGLGPFPADILVACNGVNAPRTWGSKRTIFGTSSGLCATHGSVSNPQASLCLSQPDVASYVKVRDTSSTTIADSGTSVTLTKESDSVTSEYWFKFAIDTSGAGSGTVTLAGASPALWQDGTGFVSTTGLKLDQGKQIILICNDSFTDPIWRYMKITANSAGTPVVLWDPSNPVFDQPIYYALNNSQYLVAFNIESAQVTTTTAALDFKFEILSAIPTSRDLLVYGIMAGGHVDATAQYSVTLIDPESRAESGGSVCTVRQTAKLGGAYGRGCAGSQVIENLPIPLGLYLEHLITYPTSPLSPRVAYAMLYRKDPGETSYYFVNFMGAPRTTWMYNNLSYYPDNAKAGTRYLNRTAPPASNKTIPYGAFLLGINGRLFSYRINNAPTERWISGYRMPFRFNQTASLVGPDAGTNPVYDVLSGEEIMGVTALPGQYHGASPTLTYTSKRIWRSEGTDSLALSRTTKVADIGCAFSRSIAEHNGQVYFIGTDLQAWRFGIGNDGPISLYVTDKRIKTATLESCFGAADFYGYVLSMKETGDSTYNSMLRFDGIRQQWGSDRFEVTGISGMMRFDSGTDRRLLLFGDDGKIYWHEKAGEVKDDGSYIPIKLETGELFTDMYSTLTTGAMQLVAKVPDSGSVPTLDLPTFTFTQTTTRLGTVSTSEISMQNLGTDQWLYRMSVKSGDANQGIPGVNDVGIVVKMTADAPGGMKFKSLSMNVQKGSNDHDVIH